MAVILAASGSDKLKPDSADTNFNADEASFNGSGVTIVAGSILGSGSTHIHIDPNTPKTTARMTVNGLPSTAELCIAFALRVNGPVNLANIVDETIFNQSTVLGNQLRIDFGKDGVSTTTVLAKFIYDGVQVGPSLIVTFGRVYRFGIYLKLGTLGVGNSTMRICVDDVTAGDIAVGAATTFIFVTTVNMTHSPDTAVFYVGPQTGGLAFGGLTYDVQHVSLIDTAGSGDVAAPSLRVLDPVCVSGRSVPVASGTYSQWTTNLAANVNEIPPDDDVTYNSTPVTSLTTPLNTSYTLTQWTAPTISNSNGDEILAVRATIRERAAGVQRGGQQVLLRSGATDTLGGGVVISTWLTHIYSGPQSFPIQQTDPNTGLPWTQAGYNALEAGSRCIFSIADSLDNRLTWVGVDAVYIKKPAIIVLGGSKRRRQGIGP